MKIEDRIAAALLKAGMENTQARQIAWAIDNGLHFGFQGLDVPQHFVMNPLQRELADALSGAIRDNSGSKIKPVKDGELKLGDIVVRPESYGQPYSAMVVLHHDKAKRVVRFGRAFGTASGLGFAKGSLHLDKEEFDAPYTENPVHQAVWFVIGQDLDVYRMLDLRRAVAKPKVLVEYWLRLHEALGRTPPTVLTTPTNEHELRYKCAELEHECRNRKVEIPDMPELDDPKLRTLTDPTLGRD